MMKIFNGSANDKLISLDQDQTCSVAALNEETEIVSVYTFT